MTKTTIENGSRQFGFGQRLQARADQIVDRGSQDLLVQISDDLASLAPDAELQKNMNQRRVMLSSPNIARRFFDDPQFFSIGRK